MHHRAESQHANATSLCTPNAFTAEAQQAQQVMGAS